MTYSNELPTTRCELTDTRWYPLAHLAPESGWMNDPNGVCHFDGKYHAFYQHYPFTPVWGPMHWGHATSSDLVTWKHQPVALAPGKAGEPDSGGIWSGSAIEHEGKLYAFYTGNAWVNGKDDADGKKQTQMLAVSEDGITFEKLGPVITPLDGIEDFRDPKVWRHGDRWLMVLGASVEGRGEVLLYESADLHEWNALGTAFRDPNPNVHMIECPDLFEVDGKWVLLYGPMVVEPITSGYAMRNGHNGGYVVGSFDGKKFVPETEYRPMDWGHHYYATQSMEHEGRRLVFGWMGEFAHALCSQTDGWSGQLATVREVSLDGDVLTWSPILPAGDVETKELEPGLPVELPEAGRLRLTFDSFACEALELRFDRAGQSDPTKIVLDTLAERVQLVLGQGNGAGRGYRSAPYRGGDDVDIIFDRGSLELVIGAGHEVMSSFDMAGAGPRTLTVDVIDGTVAGRLEIEAF